MSRSLSSNALQALFAQETGEALLFLVEMDHADWGSPVRIVNNNVDVVSNSDTYTAFPFEVTMPTEDQEQPQPKTKLNVCNVDRQIIALFRALATAPTVELSIVLGSTPDAIEYGPAEFKITDYSYDAQTITATMSYEDVLSEPIPADTFCPADYAGLF